MINEKITVLLIAIADIRKKITNKSFISDLNRIEELTNRIKKGDLGAKIDLKGISVSNVGNSVLELETKDGNKLKYYIDDLISTVEEFEGYPKK